MKTKRRHSREFKAEAVKLLNEQGALATAESLGVGTNLLYKWRQEFRVEEADIISHVPAPKRSSLEEENRQLRHRIRQREEGREIFKKAAVSSRDSCNPEHEPQGMLLGQRSCRKLLSLTQVRGNLRHRY